MVSKYISLKLLLSTGPIHACLCNNLLLDDLVLASLVFTIQLANLLLSPRRLAQKRTLYREEA